VSDIFRTLIVTAADAPLARDIAAALGGAGGQYMWQTPLAPTVDGPATHYVSSGWIPPAWQVMVPTQTWAQDATGTWEQTGGTPGDPLLVYHGATQAGLAVTLDEIVDLFAVCDVTEQPPFVAFERLGLMMVQPEEPAA
jgi:hypothetical protein